MQDTIINRIQLFLHADRKYSIFDKILFDFIQKSVLK